MRKDVIKLLKESLDSLFFYYLCVTNACRIVLHVSVFLSDSLINYSEVRCQRRLPSKNAQYLHDALD